ncbi:DUF1569 domain-containing protein [Ketobacter sp.]|uniref:DUF1569 domain-containing protein n=1 Tax=Ketobacter sp. TaxID=2083498 RepID=UPI000F21CD42|nr:DUF1569 domain-containing protein [Ketobacter sp.]RLT94782.1 MAG: DUF1569 domain-containing protein [Ketobacter sp.]
MNRRQFLALGGTAGAVIVTAPILSRAQGAGAPQVTPLTVAAALAQLDRLQQAEVQKAGSWNLFQVYTHLAQSVEYSMSGYPQPKSWLFQNTLGSLAFAVFAGKGSMNHSLDEAIPGAPPLAVEGDPALALQRLRQSLLAFRDYAGELQPHFAYGELSKDEYEQAHVMHLNNHLEEFVLG